MYRGILTNKNTNVTRKLLPTMQDFGWFRGHRLTIEMPTALVQTRIHLHSTQKGRYLDSCDSTSLKSDKNCVSELPGHYHSRTSVRLSYQRAACVQFGCSQRRYQVVAVRIQNNLFRHSLPNKASTGTCRIESNIPRKLYLQVLFHSGKTKSAQMGVGNDFRSK